MHYHTLCLRLLFGLSALFATELLAGPIVMTGWNADVIYENDEDPTVTNTVDGTLGGFTFTEDGLVVAGIETIGLPAGGVITSEYLNPITESYTEFQIESYTANNAAVLTHGGPAVTLELATAASFSTLQFLNATSGGQRSITLTLNFADATSITTTLQIYRWLESVQNQPIAVSDMNRVLDTDIQGTTPNVVDTGNGAIWNMNETTLDLTTLYPELNLDEKLLSSITFQDPHAGTEGQTVIFAVSGVQVPEPSTFVVLLAGGAMLMVVRPKRNRSPWYR